MRTSVLRSPTYCTLPVLIHGCSSRQKEFIRAQTPHRPHCLIVDVGLPGMSGLDLMAHLRLSGRSIPTIVTTGQEDPMIRIQAQAQGCNAFLLKPVGSDELLHAIEACGT
jgi:two-component system CheB/CheR fusion protein